jgi:RAD50-interacting protein 1
VSRLNTHILQRAILYRRPHEVTKAERRTLQREIELWVETCRLAIIDAGDRVEVPWRLVQAGRILGADDEVWTQILKVGVIQRSWPEGMGTQSHRTDSRDRTQS